MEVEMKANKFQITLFLVLAALIVNSTLVFAYPAELPDKDPFPRTPTTAHCKMIIARVKRMDIPTCCADYAALDQLPDCSVVTSLSILTVTGSRSDLGKEHYKEFKILQAELMSE
jgi:hypothetical protein